MSYLHFNYTPKRAVQAKRATTDKRTGRQAFSDYLLAKYGEKYVKEITRQRSRKNADLFKSRISGTPSLKEDDTFPLVGIVGGGFAGMYAGLMLQSLGIEFEIFEASERVGGRIDTWYSTDYDATITDQAALYGEVGGMRLPQFSPDMLPVQQLSIMVNQVLKANGLYDQMVNWRKFYYNSPVQRMRYNNMEAPIEAKDATLNTLNFDVDSGGDIPMVWLTPATDASGNQYLPINKVIEVVNDQFIPDIVADFDKGFKKLLNYDSYSMWAYLTKFFTLGDLGDYYVPAMGPKDANLSYDVTSYLETTNVGTGMYSVSFVEMVMAAYDWGGSLNPYDPSDTSIYMLTVDKGMQHLPDACKSVLNHEAGIRQEDGVYAQQVLGLLPGDDGSKGYSPNNLTKDAEPPSTVPPADAKEPATAPDSYEKQRVYTKHKITNIDYDPMMYSGHGGITVSGQNNEGSDFSRDYPYVICTLPNGNYLNGQLKTNFFDKLSFSKARAIRECNYMPSFKAFITFKSQFWAKLGERQDAGLGVGTSDRPNRQIVYPSYGYDSDKGVLQIYCWAQDAERMGALSDQERVNECIKGIQYLYPEVDVASEFMGYKPEEYTKTWFWDNHAGGGAFALFNPGQFENLYGTLLTPEFDGCLNLAGECCSVHHGWIVGALDSAYNAVNNILEQNGAIDKIAQLERTFGTLTAPNVASIKEQMLQFA